MLTVKNQVSVIQTFHTVKYRQKGRAVNKKEDIIFRTIFERGFYDHPKIAVSQSGFREKRTFRQKLREK